MPESNVDVLIVGAGPAGHMAATWLSKYRGLKVRLIEKRNSKIFAGQADGLQCRTLEIFQSFGFADRALKDANHMLEICFWDPDENGIIHRTNRIADVLPGLSRFLEIVLHQGYIEGYFQDHLQKYNGALPERGIMPEKMEIDESRVGDPDAYPIRLVLRKLPEEEATPEQFGHKISNGLFRSTNLTTETEEDEALRGSVESREVVHAKYVVGCDGAHSWVRRQLGFRMEGEQTDYVWGVIDVVPLTNFPDIRYRSAIHSRDHGSVMVIPREKGLVRFYIQLSDVARLPNGMIDRSKVTPEQILANAQRIMAPYTLTYNEIHWFTAYQIGQRVANKFSKFDRVFIVGDASHTHSPKAGQGMNVSMQDSYNLGWKLGAVCSGQLQCSALSTYQSERQQIAHNLINFDKKFAKIFSSNASSPDYDAEEFQQVFEESYRFATGINVHYDNSCLVGDAASRQSLATEIPIGNRFPSYRVLNQSDARSWELQDRMPSDGRWRVVVFAGDVKNPQQMERVNKLGEYLDRPTSFPTVYSPPEAEWNSFIQILTVHSSPRWDVELSDFPKALRREHDYNSVFVDDKSYHNGHGEAYKNYGVDKTKGCVVVVRPDGYVSLVVELEDTEKMEVFFGGCLVKQSMRKA